MTEPASLGSHRYGKRAIRLVKVVRGDDAHHLRDLTVDVLLEGDFAASYTQADNSLVIATDTMKNTVYALAPEHLTGAIEAYGLVLGRHFAALPPVVQATVTISEHGWRRLEGGRGPAPHAFQRTGAATRTAGVVVGSDGETVESGVTDLVVLKTTDSAFAGFPRDRYTTLPETDDRLLATRITASWRHGTGAVDWDASHAAVQHTLLEVFADHHSESVQHSIWLMGNAILERHPGIDEVRMSLPNLHHWRVDLTPFDARNGGEVYVATTEPHGLIEATVRRGMPPP